MTVEPRLPSWWLEDALAARGRCRARAARSTATRAPTSRSSAAATPGSGRRSRCGSATPTLRVTLVEAEICGAGPSGRNGGFCHGYWAALSSVLPRARRGGLAARSAAPGEQIVPAVPRARRRRLAARGRAARRLRRAGAGRLGRARPSRPPRASGIRRRPSRSRREELAQRVRSPVFRSGVYFRDGATVHPGLLVRALRRRALAAGVDVHEQTPALRVRDGEITTPNGALRAPEIVLATNAALTGWRPAARSLTNFGSYVVLTEPVPELLEEINWTGGEAIVDGRMFIHYFRTLDDGRVLMGSGSGPIGFGGKIDERFSRDRRDGRARGGRAAPPAARARRRARRALVGRPDRRLRRPSAVLRHEARHAHPLRRGLLGARRRPELARRPDPRLARARAPTTSGRGCRSRRAACRRCRPSRSAASAAGSCAPRSWRARRRRSGARGRRSCACGRRDPAASADGARDPLMTRDHALRRRPARRAPERARDASSRRCARSS